MDLTGDYGQDLEANIVGGVGEATVMLPSEVGARVRAEGGLGKINAEGFRREGQAYVNDAYANSDVTLEVDVHGGVWGDQPGRSLRLLRSHYIDEAGEHGG